MIAFRKLDFSTGLIAQDLDPNYPCDLFGVSGVAHLKSARSTYYGFVHSGFATLMIGDTLHGIGAGMYFSVPGPADIMSFEEWHGKPPRMILIERREYRGVFALGGPIESWGRLRYIDGCTDSLLLSPTRKGDPCLNALYFPPGVDQTRHTHPSVRVGIVVSGRGVCWAEGVGELPLMPGMLWCIEADGPHKFRTDAEPLVVIAFHPDSDFGPEDEDHPMINRTIIEGISAKDPAGLERDIRTGKHVRVEG